MSILAVGYRGGHLSILFPATIDGRLPLVPRSGQGGAFLYVWWCVGDAVAGVLAESPELRGPVVARMDRCRALSDRHERDNRIVASLLHDLSGRRLAGFLGERVWRDRGDVVRVVRIASVGLKKDEVMLLPYCEAGRIEAGCDEAGRGCLAGAVFAAAVILPEDFRSEELNDSKQLSERKRYALRPVIEREAIAWAVGIVTPEEIDRINILRASFLAMHRAIDQLRVKPAHLLIDGNRFTPYPGIPHTTVVKGDGKYLSIAAASILAKTYRDDYMNRLAEEYPAYHWDENKGYPTRAHREAIRMHGITPYHRKTFTLLPEQLELKF